jgi:hypothetical protein
MILRACSPLRQIATDVLVIASCAMVICAAVAGGQEVAKGKNRPTLHIELQDAQGARVAGPVVQPLKGKTAVLAIERAYQPGDRIVFSGPQWMALRVDDGMPECIIFAPHAATENATYEIPWGRAEKQTGSAYALESFAGNSHRITLRTLSRREVSGERNLALNPCDLMRSDEASVQFFPHASSNSVSRSLFDFEARNAIDGRVQNGHHGVWPYQSWGPQLRTDIWWKLDFGKPVVLNKIRVMVRADFPHDSYWKSVDVEFSDGSRLPLSIGPFPEFQDFSFSKRRVSWLRLVNVVPADPAKWCSLIEVEAWGRDTH